WVARVAADATCGQAAANTLEPLLEFRRGAGDRETGQELAAVQRQRRVVLLRAQRPQAGDRVAGDDTLGDGEHGLAVADHRVVAQCQTQELDRLPQRSPRMF